MLNGSYQLWINAQLIQVIQCWNQCTLYQKDMTSINPEKPLLKLPKLWLWLKFKAVLKNEISRKAFTLVLSRISKEQHEIASTGSPMQVYVFMNSNFKLINYPSVSSLIFLSCMKHWQGRIICIISVVQFTLLFLSFTFLSVIPVLLPHWSLCKCFPKRQIQLFCTKLLYGMCEYILL